MASTYEAIATEVASGSSGTINFNSIPSTYTDLVLVSSNYQSNLYCLVRFNSDSGSNYNRVVLQGNASTTSSYTGRNETSTYLTSQPHSSTRIYIFSYADTNKWKAMLSRTGNGIGKEITAGAACWRSTSAITSVNISAISGNFSAGSYFTLYGIKAA